MSHIIIFHIIVSIRDALRKKLRDYLGILPNGGTPPALWEPFPPQKIGGGFVEILVIFFW